MEQVFDVMTQLQWVASYYASYHYKKQWWEETLRNVCHTLTSFNLLHAHDRGVGMGKGWVRGTMVLLIFFFRGDHN